MVFQTFSLAPKPFASPPFFSLDWSPTMKRTLRTLLLGISFCAASALANAQSFTPPKGPACFKGMPNAATCDLDARAHTACAKAKSKPEFDNCLRAFTTKTPRDCAGWAATSEKAICDAHNATKAGVTGFTPPTGPSCTKGMRDGATCDLDARAHKACASAKSTAEFNGCMKDFYAKTPRDCAGWALTKQRATCEAANARFKK
jgi:hypothetical protein